MGMLSPECIPIVQRGISDRSGTRNNKDTNMFTTIDFLLKNIDKTRLQKSQRTDHTWF